MSVDDFIHSLYADIENIEKKSNKYLIDGFHIQYYIEFARSIKWNWNIFSVFNVENFKELM